MAQKAVETWALRLFMAEADTNLEPIPSIDHYDLMLTQAKQFLEWLEEEKE